MNQAWLKRTPSHKEQVVVARLSTVLILTIALIIMANLGSIQTAWYISLLFGAGMGSVLVLRWLWERTNQYSELAAMAASLIVAPILLLTVEEEWLKLLLMSVLSTTTVVIVTLLTPKTDESVLETFYKQVNPPGFWRKTAARLGGDRQEPVLKLREGAYLVLTTATTIFLLLVGIGKFLLHDPSGSILWAWLYVLLGFASISLWWKKVFPGAGA